MKNFFTAHLKEVNETYWEHFRQAGSFAGWMFVGSIVCLIHAIAPFSFVKTGSSIITKLHDRMVANRVKSS